MGVAILSMTHSQALADLVGDCEAIDTDQWDGKSVLRLGPGDRPGRCTCHRGRAWDGPQPENPPWFAKLIYGSEPREKGLFPGATGVTVGSTVSARLIGA